MTTGPNDLPAGPGDSRGMAQEKGKPGRPSMLKDPARAAILEAIEMGCPFVVAAEAAGVSYETFNGWRKQGRKDVDAKQPSVFAEFYREVKKAEARFVRENMRGLRAAAEDPRYWTARAWQLERRRPEEFADNRKELAALRRQVEDLIKALGGQRPPDAPPAAPAGG